METRAEKKFTAIVNYIVNLSLGRLVTFNVSVNYLLITLSLVYFQFDSIIDNRLGHQSGSRYSIITRFRLLEVSCGGLSSSTTPTLASHVFLMELALCTGASSRWNKCKPFSSAEVEP